MSLKEFREILLEQILAFLWRQWSILGVLGEAGTEDYWIIDPEPLFIFSLEIGRYDPRLFDEILGWMQVNGYWLDTARLRRILQQQKQNVAQVAGGVLQHLLSHGDSRKWKNIVQFCERLCKKEESFNVIEPLFKEKSGRFHPLVREENADPNFLRFQLNRPIIKTEREGREVPINTGTNIRFLLRFLFGTGAKSESILYLLTHEGARPREIADDVGLFWLGIHQALLELSMSGLVLTRSKGKKVEYWLSQKKWWEFLASSSLETSSPPRWLNWIAIFSALSHIWNTIDELSSGKESDYMKSSKLQDSMEIVSQEFARSGYDLPRMPTMGIPSELHQKVALKFLGKIFGVIYE